MGLTPDPERLCVLVAVDLSQSFLTCHIPPLSFILDKLFSLLFLFFCCFYCLTLSMTSSRASCLFLRIPSPAGCPSSAPHSDFDSRLINLSFFRLPWTDVDSNEGGRRAEKETAFLPSLLELPRHIRETIIRNDVLSSVLIASLEHTHYRWNPQIIKL